MQATPADLGMPFEDTVVPVDGLDLPAWFIPARDGARVRAWCWSTAGSRVATGRCRWRTSSTRPAFTASCSTCAATGPTEPELLPISGGEFGRDTLAAVDVLFGRPEVTAGAVSGHSMGAIGAILAAAADRRVAALVATSGPADPYRLTRQTFRLANLPIPDPIAYPLAWLTTRVFLRPRGHRVAEVELRSARSRPTRARCCSRTATRTRSSRSATSSGCARRPSRRAPAIRTPCRWSTS